MSKGRRIAAVLCGIFALMLALSGLVSAVHWGHGCLDSDCPVCAALSHWELLRRLGALAALVLPVLWAAAAAGPVRAFRLGRAASPTLVSLGVKLSD